MINPAVHPIEVRVYTSEFRVYGMLHMRPNTGTAWLLNADERQHLPLSQVSMYRTGYEHPPEERDLVYGSHFAAIPKAAIMWVQGGYLDDAKAGLGLEPREAYLVFPTYIITGFLLVRPEVRLSDVVGQVLTKKTFVNLRRARILGQGAPGTYLAQLPAMQEHEFVTVNLRRVAAVFDARGGNPVMAFGIDEAG